MQCPACHTDNPETAKFCLNCGSKLAAPCAVCGAALPAQAKFCPECGAAAGAVPAAAPPEQDSAFTQALQRLVPKEFADRLRATHGQAGQERRLVTILFS